MDKITEEILQTIYRRAREYATIKWGEPDRISFGEEGNLYALYTTYCCGDFDETYETITAENLTEDLDEVAKQREIELEEKRKKIEIYDKQQKIIRENMEKEERKQKYLQLKKEFEN